MKRKVRTGIIAVLANAAVLCSTPHPFLFVVLNSLKDRRAAAQMKLSWPATFHPENYAEVVKVGGGMLVTAFKNSTVITFAVVVLTVIVCSMTAFYVQRRDNRTSKVVSFLLLIGLMVPVAIMPTICAQALGLFRHKLGLILVQTAVGMPFSMMLFRSYIASIPREIDEAAMIDGCGPGRLFFQIIFHAQARYSHRGHSLFHQRV